MRAQDQTGPLGHDTMDESKDRRKGGIRQEHRWARRGTEDSTQPGPEAVVVPRESSKQSPGRSPQENTRSCNDIEGDGVHLAGQPATPFQRLLKSSTSLVSSAVKGVIGLMSPWEENGRSDGDGQMLVAQESFSSGEYDDVHSAERVDKAAHEAAPSMAAYEDGAVELPPPEDKAESDESYEGQPVDSITVSELKKILREKGLSYKGRKSELAERLKEWLRSQRGHGRGFSGTRGTAGQANREEGCRFSSASAHAATSAAVARQLVQHADEGLLRPEELPQARGSAGAARGNMRAQAAAKLHGAAEWAEDESLQGVTAGEGGRLERAGVWPAQRRRAGPQVLVRPAPRLALPSREDADEGAGSPGSRSEGGLEEAKSSMAGSGGERGARGGERVFGVMKTLMHKKKDPSREWEQRAASPSGASRLPSNSNGGNRVGYGTKARGPGEAFSAVVSTLEEEMPDLTFMADPPESTGPGDGGFGVPEVLRKTNQVAALHRDAARPRFAGGQAVDKGAVRFDVGDDLGREGKPAASRFRTTPYVEKSRPVYGNAGAWSGSRSVSSAYKRSLAGAADPGRAVRRRQAPRAPSRWSDLVTRRILNSMQEQMRTPMQDARSQYVPTPLRSRALPAREVGEVSPPREGMPATELPRGGLHDRSRVSIGLEGDQALSVQPSRLLSGGHHKRRFAERARDAGEDGAEEGGLANGRGEPATFKLPRHVELPEPKPVFGVDEGVAEALARMDGDAGFDFTAPQAVHMDEEEGAEAGATMAKPQEEFIFTPPVKRRLRPRRAAAEQVHREKEGKQEEGRQALKGRAGEAGEGHEQQSFLNLGPEDGTKKAETEGQKEHGRGPPTPAPRAPGLTGRALGSSSLASSKTVEDRAAMPPPPSRKVTAPTDLSTDKPATGGGWGDLQARLQKPGSWKCSGCLSNNIDAAKSKCPSCEAPKPGTENVSSVALAASTRADAVTPGSISPHSGPLAADFGAITSKGFSFGGGTSEATSATPMQGSPFASTKIEEEKNSEKQGKAFSGTAAPPTFGGGGKEAADKVAPTVKPTGFSFIAPPADTTEPSTDSAKEEAPDGGKTTAAQTALPAISPFVFGTTDVAKEKEPPAPKLPAFAFGASQSSTSTADVGESGKEDTSKATAPPTSTPSFTFWGAGVAGGASTSGDATFGAKGNPPVPAPDAPSVSPPGKGPEAPAPLAFPPLRFDAPKSSPGVGLLAAASSTFPAPSGSSTADKPSEKPASAFSLASSDSSTTSFGGLKSTPSFSAVPTSLSASGSGSTTNADPSSGSLHPVFTFGSAPAPSAPPSGASSAFAFGTTAGPKAGSGGIGLGSAPSQVNGAMDMSASPGISPGPAPAPAFGASLPSFSLGNASGASKPPLFGASSALSGGAGGFGVGLGSATGGAAAPVGVGGVAPALGTASAQPLFGAASNPPMSFQQAAPLPAGGMFGPSAPQGVATGGFGVSGGAPSFGGFGAAGAGIPGGGAMPSFGAPAPSTGDAFSLGASTTQQAPGHRKIIKARRPVRK